MKIEGNCVVLYPPGRVDSTNAEALKAQIDEAMARNPGLEPVVDMEQTDYISSAALRVLMSVSKALGKPLTVRNVSPEVYEIFDVTGFTSILDVRRRLRQVDVTGCPVVGKGAYGTVYRIDADTIVKVYDVPDAPELIRNEQARARQAFLKGLPTAISFDMVRVGEKYGAVFEMVDARTFNKCLIDEPRRLEEICRLYAGVMHSVHDVEVEPGQLPDARKVYMEQLEQIRDVLPEETSGKLRTLLEAMGEDLHLLHGDFHMKNVMLSNGEPVLIDMDSLSTGDPVFDFAGLFTAYVAYGEDDPDNTMHFFGLPTEMCRKIMQRTLADYLAGYDERVVRQAEDRIAVLGYVRFLYLLVVRKLGNEERMRVQIDHAARRLTERLSRVECLQLAGL